MLRFILTSVTPALISIILSPSKPKPTMVDRIIPIATVIGTIFGVYYTVLYSIELYITYIL